MEPNEYRVPPPPPPPPPLIPPPLATRQPVWEPAAEPTGWQKVKKFIAPLGALGVLALKFLPMLLKTGGTMILSVVAYSLAWGIWFGAGFVALIFIHESGHLLAAKRLGLKVGAPVFIPFMGAFIALKEAPRNAWMEAQVGIGGPMLGAVGAAICYLIYRLTGKPLFEALAYMGFWLNLFNLAPLGFLDGGRVVTALSPWLWLAGLVIVGGLLFVAPNWILVLVLLVSLPRLFSLFRARTEEERRYYEVTPAQRWTMALIYFGLVALLVLGMEASWIAPERLQRN